MKNYWLAMLYNKFFKVRKTQIFLFKKFRDQDEFRTISSKQ